MGLQIPCSHRIEISKEKAVREGKNCRGGHSSGIIPAARVEILEGHLMPDHVHMCLQIPPKYSVAYVIGFLKGKSAVKIHRRIGNKRVTGLHFWSRGYCVSTVGLDEATVRKYIREQEKAEKEQLGLNFE